MYPRDGLHGVLVRASGSVKSSAHQHAALTGLVWTLLAHRERSLVQVNQSHFSTTSMHRDGWAREPRLLPMKGSVLHPSRGTMERTQKQLREQQTRQAAYYSKEPWTGAAQVSKSGPNHQRATQSNDRRQQSKRGGT